MRPQVISDFILDLGLAFDGQKNHTLVSQHAHTISIAFRQVSLYTGQESGSTAYLLAHMWSCISWNAM